MASAVYCLNDLKDVEADRHHPVKCKRPIASGAISKNPARAIFALLVFVLSYQPTTERLFPHFVNQFYKYNGLCIIMFGIAILHIFTRWKFHNRYINYISSSTLSIYLIHENHKISYFVYIWPTKQIENALCFGGGGYTCTNGANYYRFVYNCRSNKNSHL